MNLRLRTLNLLACVCDLLGDGLRRPVPPDARRHGKRRHPAAASPAPAPPAPPAAASAVPEPGELFRDCAECAEMVVIPSGEFKMGSEDTIYEKPVHRVVIPSAFAIGRREVTFDEWDLCVAAGVCKYRPDDRGWGRGNRPVIDVSWDDAHDFVSWMTQKTGKKYRLPSEAEWEYAARAGTESPFWWGRTLIKGSANCEDCGDAPLRKTTPAQSFRPNGFELSTSPATSPNGSRIAGTITTAALQRTAPPGPAANVCSARCAAVPLPPSRLLRARRRVSCTTGTCATTPMVFASPGICKSAWRRSPIARAPPEILHRN